MKAILSRRPAALLFVFSGTLLISAPSHAEDRDLRPSPFGRVFIPGPPPQRPVRRVRVQPGPPPQQRYYAAVHESPVIYADDPAAVQNANTRRVVPGTITTSTNAMSQPLQHMEIPVHGTRPLVRDHGTVYLDGVNDPRFIGLDDSGRPVYRDSNSQASAPVTSSGGRTSYQQEGAGLTADPQRRYGAGTSTNSAMSDRGSATSQNVATSSSTTTKSEGASAGAKSQAAPAKTFPMALVGSRPGFVKTPFEPYHELDATGLYSGMLAKDPMTGKIFRVP